MTVLNPEAGAWCLDERSRKVTRPALTTAIMIMLAIMIVMDVFKRRRRSTEPTTD
jgi:hypothetical protein